MYQRADGRAAGQMRSIALEPGVSRYAEGSVMASLGHTRVLCMATVEDRVPPFLRGRGQGWVTAEYGMLPRATKQRNQRLTGGRVDGRSLEIQRLIGRSLRAVVDLEPLGERTIILDCDVLQADGGTRTLSITAAFVAMIMALRKLQAQEQLEKLPIKDYLAATSVGLIDNQVLVDLDHQEDSLVDVDFNVVATGGSRLVEVQGTAEGALYERAQVDAMLDAALPAVDRLISIQKQCLQELEPHHE